MSFEVKLPPEDLAKLSESLNFLPPEPPAQAKKRVRMPARGTMIGGLLGVICAAILLRSFVFTAGYDATLVANLGYVRAPFTGVLREAGAEVGDRVKRDETLGAFAAQVGLAAVVQAASQDERQIRARIASLDARIATLKAMQGRIQGEAASYRSTKVAQVGALAAESGAAIAAADARAKFADSQWERAKALADKGFLSAAGLENARQARDAARADRAAAVARQRGDAIERDAAARGLLLGSGYSDVQYSTQRLSELTMTLSQLQGERDTLAAALDAQRNLASTNSAFDRQVRVPLHASVNGRVWAKAAAPGETVREGEPIYVLADCSSFFAYFVVGRVTYSGLAVGDKVTFIASSNGDHWPGRIVNLGVNDPGQLRLTSQIERPGADRYLVGARILLHPEDQRACPVGTPGRVVLGGD
jgi:multidrug resistance efflux pump